MKVEHEISQNEIGDKATVLFCTSFDLKTQST